MMIRSGRSVLYAWELMTTAGLFLAVFWLVKRKWKQNNVARVKAGYKHHRQSYPICWKNFVQLPERLHESVAGHVHAALKNQQNPQLHQGAPVVRIPVY